MNYKKLIILLLFILFILFNCFNVREGFLSWGEDDNIVNKGPSINGEKFRKKFCNFLSNKVEKKGINITNFNYNKAHLCKTFTYDNFKDINMVECLNNLNNLEKKDIDIKNKYFKSFNKVKDYGQDNLVFDNNEIKTILNCRLITDDDLENQFITNIYEDEFSEKEPITNFKILSSYNSSCVYLDDSKEFHDLDQITFLFNLGVRYFDFCVVNPVNSSSDFIISSEPKYETLKDDSKFITLKNAFETIYDNTKNSTTTQFQDLSSIKKLYENLSPGSPSNEDPLIIHLKICINFNELLKDDDTKIKTVFNSIYDKILVMDEPSDPKDIKLKEQKMREYFYLDGSIKNQLSLLQSNNNGKLSSFLNVSIDKLKGKIILLVDYLSYNKKIIDKDDDLKKQTINKAFKHSKLAGITSMVVNDRGVLNTPSTPNYKKIKKSNESIQDDVIDKDSFYILQPADPYYGKKNQKKGTYTIDTVQNYKNGVNVIAFPFYLVKNDNNVTFDNFVNYYNQFNNDDGNASSLKLIDDSTSSVNCSIQDIIDKPLSKQNIVDGKSLPRDNSDIDSVDDENTESRKYFKYTIN